MIGEIYDKKAISAYQPSADVIKLTEVVKKDYTDGTRILEKPWVELNYRSVIDDINLGQEMMNAFVDTSLEDPNEAWKWRGTGSVARNKAMATHAQFMSNFILPLFVAQNNDDEIDKGFSEVMRDIVEWMCDPTNYSNYQSSYLQIGFGMLQNPVTYLGAEFYEIYQTIKEKSEDGTITKKEVLDEVLSGFKCPIYSATQVLIVNAYERNIQKQRAIIKRRSAEYSELEAKYGEHENWQYVQEGIKSIYNEENGLFYDIKDDDHPKLVMEETWENRREDTEVCFVNGIYLGEPNVDENPVRHRDNRNVPKYNLVPFGYQRINEHFYFYKSMMNVMVWDNTAYDAMQEAIYNRSILDIDAPIAISGTDEVDSGVIFPKAVISLENSDARISPILPPANLADGFNALRERENSLNNSTVNETLSGQLPDASQKVTNVLTAQNNGKKLLGEVGRSLGESLTQLGDLMKDIVINHIVVAQVQELVGDKLKMKYPTFLFDNKKNGKKMGTRSIKMDESLIGAEMTDAEKLSEELKMLESSGYPHEAKSIR